MDHLLLLKLRPSWIKSIQKSWRKVNDKSSLVRNPLEDLNGLLFFYPERAKDKRGPIYSHLLHGYVREVMPHSSVVTNRDLVGVVTKILYLPAGRQGGNLIVPLER
jgi:hypothetical protein